MLPWLNKQGEGFCMHVFSSYVLYIYISYFDIYIHANDQIHVWKHYLQVFYVSGKMLEYILRFMPERAKTRHLFLLHLILYFSMSIRFSPSHLSLWWWRIAHEHEIFKFRVSEMPLPWLWGRFDRILIVRKQRFSMSKFTIW